MELLPTSRIENVRFFTPSHPFASATSVLHTSQNGGQSFSCVIRNQGAGQVRRLFPAEVRQITRFSSFRKGNNSTTPRGPRLAHVTVHDETLHHFTTVVYFGGTNQLKPVSLSSSGRRGRDRVDRLRCQLGTRVTTQCRSKLW